MSTLHDYSDDTLKLPIPNVNEPLEVILKLPGEGCNLNCLYCYEKRQPDSSNGVISTELIKRLGIAAKGRPLSIGLHGGEPLLIGKERMRSLLEAIIKELNVYDIKLQTNGVLLDREWIDILTSPQPPVIIGVSHDGPGSLSKMRIDYSGSFQSSDSEKAVSLLSESDVQFGVICVVSQSNISEPDRLIRYFASFVGLKTLNLVPCFDYSVQSRAFYGGSGEIIRNQNPRNQGLPAWAVTPLEFLVHLKEIWRAWQRYPQFIIEPFVSIIRSLSGKHPESCDFTIEKCAHVLTLYPDGRLTSCDEFENEIAKFSQINLSERARLPNNDDYRLLVDEADVHLRKCQECSHRSSCGGGCIATRRRYYGSPFYEEYCNYKKNIIDFVANEIDLPEKT